MKTVTLLVISFMALLTVTWSQNAGDPYRLPRTVQLINYNIHLTLNQDFHIKKIFEGSTTIRFKTGTTPVSEITLHSVKLTFDKNLIAIKKNESDETEKSLFAKLIDTPNDYEFIKIQTTEPLAVNTEYVVSFANFNGSLWEDMYGFYLSSYPLANNQVEYLVTTQFQTTFARRAFPCFDEPNFKATFDITITHPPEYSTVVSNTILAAGTGTTSVFKTTPKMSTYLVAFIVSKFDSPKREGNYTVYGRKEAVASLNYSHELGKLLINKLQDYMGIPYKEYMAKLDQAAIPDFAAGAMENWGLLTYRETALLYDETQSTKRNKQSVATTIAHEMTHQWLGDLVTLDWWSVSWLNEGFARYFQYFITAEVEKQWELEKQFVVEQQQVVFGVDALSTSLPMTSKVSTPAEAQAKFDSITYNKAASVIRMMRHVLGEKFFKKALQKYLKDNQFRNVVPKNLIDAFHNYATGFPNGVTVEMLMDNWINKPGYPVVNVTLNKDNTVTLKQERFLLKGTDTNSKWIVPISYATSNDGKNFSNTLPRFWLKDTDVSATMKGVTLKENDWIVLNVQESAYYRVNYDQKLWNNLKNALLKDKFDGIDEINRAQIVDDALNLARARKLTYDKAFDVISFLENDVGYYPWYSAYSSFSFLLARVGGHPKLEKFLKDRIVKLSGKLTKSVPMDVAVEGHVSGLKQSLALEWACKLGHAECIKKTTGLFDKFQKGTPVNPNLRNVVYCTGVREAKEQLAAWNFLWNEFKKTSWAQEKNTIITALGCTKDENLLTGYLQKSIEGKDIRKQDAGSVFTAVCNGNPVGITVGFDFLKNNIKKIAEQYGGLNALGKVVMTLAKGFTTTKQIEDLEKFYKENKKDFEKAGKSVESAIENAKANLEIKAALENELLPRFSKSSMTRRRQFDVVAELRDSRPS